jgi:hypothetical protein
MEEHNDIQAQREDFRKYLEQSGIIHQMTQVLVRLFEENELPKDPLLFIQRHLGVPKGMNVEALQKENEDLKLKCEDLEATVDELLDQLEALKAVKNQ